MKVAIIGTGNIGKALGGTLTRAGHDVTVLSQDPPSGGRELRGTPVTLEVSGGQRFVVVPTLTGLTAVGVPCVSGSAGPDPARQHRRRRVRTGRGTSR